MEVTRGSVIDKLDLNPSGLDDRKPNNMHVEANIRRTGVVKLKDLNPYVPPDRGAEQGVRALDSESIKVELNFI